MLRVSISRFSLGSAVSHLFSLLQGNCTMALQKQSYPVQTMQNTFQISYPVVGQPKYLTVFFILFTFVMYIAVVTINGLATTGTPGMQENSHTSSPVESSFLWNTTGIFNSTTTNVSQKYEVEITPAGWTFGLVWWVEIDLPLRSRPAFNMILKWFSK